MEETGFPAKKVHELGCYAPCTARLSNRVHSFFIETGPRVDPPMTEAGIELKLVTPRELAAMIISGEFVLQLHIGALLLAGMRGHLDLGELRVGEIRPLTSIKAMFESLGWLSEKLNALAIQFSCGLLADYCFDCAGLSC